MTRLSPADPKDPLLMLAEIFLWYSSYSQRPAPEIFRMSVNELILESCRYLDEKYRKLPALDSQDKEGNNKEK
jgi:hypothetical protein